MRKPHTLTKACPHRWCRPLHRVLATESIVLLAAISIHQLAYLAYLLVLVVLVTAVVSLTTRRTATDRAMDDFKRVDPADVRVGWANLAVSLDLAFAVIGPLAIAGVLQAEHNTMIITAVGQGPAATIIGTLVSCVPPVLSTVSHYLATRPRRRKRVLVPATN
ncbi:hypothetical protein PUR61_38645 [Streptomyces sp. BE20]|uniref:hypothetical protein n=1 Tax=Streptomyces sp. BE20 TaxID=3002525 RepID=UPI002E778A7F|nr:hypothetical protein [Streptomyces sp. BE20]MEE1828056.1 hypothetical protein [Streptomyces sp. BE20]